MKLNDSITTYDIAEALQGEQGKFEVTSPTENAISLRANRDTQLAVSSGLAMKRIFSPFWCARWRNL
jgi:hypothetical protein